MLRFSIGDLLVIKQNWLKLLVSQVDMLLARIAAGPCLTGLVRKALS